MGQKKHPFNRTLTVTAVAGDNDVQTDPVVAGRLYCIQRVTVENETTAYTSLRILKDGVGGPFTQAYEDAPDAATPYWSGDPFYLTEGQYVICRMAGCTLSDALRVYLSGYWQESREV